MAVAGMKWGWMWAQHFGGVHTYSVTVQVHNRNVVADIGLFGKWVGGDNHNSAMGGITQMVSNSGVENFPIGVYNCTPTLFRLNVTSVTFTVRVFQAHGMTRWMIYDWV